MASLRLRGGAASAVISLPQRRSARLAARTILEAVPVLARNPGDGEPAQDLKKDLPAKRKQAHPRKEIIVTADSDNEVVNQAPAAKVSRATKAKAFPTRALEEEKWALGYKYVVGVDEAGRGPLAGPVVAAACILPRDLDIQAINDSKKMSKDDREEVYALLTSMPGVHYAVHVVENDVIDEINILQATLKAMEGATSSLEELVRAHLSSPSQGSAALALEKPDLEPLLYYLVDGNRLPALLKPAAATAVIQGDGISTAIAAASILAKVTRDRIMVEYNKKWPEYGFGDHKGYGTVAHMAAIRRFGPLNIHRRSFEPIKSMVAGKKSASDPGQL